MLGVAVMLYLRYLDDDAGTDRLRHPSVRLLTLLPPGRRSRGDKGVGHFVTHLAGQITAGRLFWGPGKAGQSSRAGPKGPCADGSCPWHRSCRWGTVKGWGLLININKLFPRLPIRVKLAVAFALLATVPFVVSGALGTRVTLRHMQAWAAGTLDHDLQSVRERTEQFLAAVEEDIEYLAESSFRQVLETGSHPSSLDSAVAAFLRLKPSFIQVKLFSPDGEPILVAPAAGGGSVETAGGAYYALRARSLKPGDCVLLPVEIRGRPDRLGGIAPIPAIAVVYPLHDTQGMLVGVAVGEAYASKLFMALESVSPQLAGVTGLVNGSGQFLYHSERKSDWSRLLARRPEVNLFSDFPPEVAQQILGGESGSLWAEGDQLISFAPLRLHGPDGRPLFIYRVIPISLIERPARRFLWSVGTAGLFVLAAALVLAVLAATQFTRPIYQLREGARRLAAGDFGQDVKVETNDELEDLAADFTHMAGRLREHRQQLEDQVASRTEALREAHAELEEILAHSEDAILRLDGDGHVRVWNRGAEKMFGHSPAEAIGRHVDALLLPPGRAGRREAALIERALERTGALLDHHTVRLRKDGQAVEVSLSQTVIHDASGAPRGCTLIMRDVKRQKTLEKQMLRSERLAAAGRLAAGVAHEINNPIGIILNRLDCLDLDITERCSDCFVRADLRVIRDQTERVGEVASGLLSFARDEPDERVPLDLNDVVVRVIRFLEPTLEKKALHIDLGLAGDLPSLRASPQGLETVLLNLLLNAADASREGGAISVATHTVDGGRAVELDVSDAGSGIPPDLLERIFEPFFTTKQRPRGTGLGLAVSRNIVQVHGGEMRVRSSPGEGSCFTVTLPVEPAGKDGDGAYPDR